MDRQFGAMRGLGINRRGQTERGSELRVLILFVQEGIADRSEDGGEERGGGGGAGDGAHGVYAGEADGGVGIAEAAEGGGEHAGEERGEGVTGVGGGEEGEEAE